MLRHKLTFHRDRLLGRDRDDSKRHGPSPLVEVQQCRDDRHSGSVSPPPRSAHSSNSDAGMRAKSLEVALFILPPKLKGTRPSDVQQQLPWQRQARKPHLLGPLTRLTHRQSKDSIWGSPLNEEAVALGLVSPVERDDATPTPSNPRPLAAKNLSPRRIIKPSASVMSLRGMFKLPQVTEESAVKNNSLKQSFSAGSPQSIATPGSSNLRVPGAHKQDSFGKRLSRRLSDKAPNWRGSRVSVVSNRSYSTFQIEDVQAALEMAPMPPPRPLRPPRSFSPLDVSPPLSPGSSGEHSTLRGTRNGTPLPALSLRSVRSAQELAKLQSRSSSPHNERRQEPAAVCRTALPHQRRHYPPRPPAPTAPLPPTPPSPGMSRLPSLTPACFDPLLPPTPVSSVPSFSSAVTSVAQNGWNQDERAVRERQAGLTLTSSPLLRGKGISQPSTTDSKHRDCSSVDSPTDVPLSASTWPSDSLCDDEIDDEVGESTSTCFDSGSNRLTTPATSVTASSRPSVPPRSSNSVSSKARSEIGCVVRRVSGAASYASSTAASRTPSSKTRSIVFAKPLPPRPYRSVKARPPTPATALSSLNGVKQRNALPLLPANGDVAAYVKAGPAASRHKRGISGSSRAGGRSRANTYEWDPETKTIIGAYLAGNRPMTGRTSGTS